MEASFPPAAHDSEPAPTLASSSETTIRQSSRAEAQAQTVGTEMATPAAPSSSDSERTSSHGHEDPHSQPSGSQPHPPAGLATIRENPRAEASPSDSRTAPGPSNKESRQSRSLSRSPEPLALAIPTHPEEDPQPQAIASASSARSFQSLSTNQPGSSAAEVRLPPSSEGSPSRSQYGEGGPDVRARSPEPLLRQPGEAEARSSQAQTRTPPTETIRLDPRPRSERQMLTGTTQSETGLPRRRSFNEESQSRVLPRDVRPAVRRADSGPHPGPSSNVEGPQRETPRGESRAWVRTHSPEPLPPRQPEEIQVRSSQPGSQASVSSPRIFNAPSPYTAAVPTAPPPPPKPLSIYRQTSARPRSELDWIVPVTEPKREPRPKNIEERLRPTIEAAKAELAQCKKKALLTGYALNIAIGLQVVFGALTTGLSAALSGHHVSLMTAVLGGMSTVVATYLARVRGTNEPEVSIARGKDLEGFVRECEVFVLDYGYLIGNDYDAKLKVFRNRFEEMMGKQLVIRGYMVVRHRDGLLLIIYYYDVLCSDATRLYCLVCTSLSRASSSLPSMDAPLNPPLRVAALSSKPLTNKSTQKRLELFLEDFQNRSTAAQGGQPAVTVQIQKLCTALTEERAAGKA
ncbi:hypothetical protein C8F01DRAFT_1274211 [Mycena amicta]|nr:hypothetical protein C8F01DRAFT_1274211 [Mycena amicta]